MEEKLPRNARFLVDLNEVGVDSAAITWVQLEAEEELAFTTAPAGKSPLVFWLVPEVLLEADTTYEIRVGDSKPWLWSTRFTTSSLVDEVPPKATAPQFEAAKTQTCGASATARLIWDSLDDNGVAMTYEPIVRVRAKSGKREAELFLDAKNLLPGRGIDLVAPRNSSSEDCWGHFALPFEEDDVLNVQLTVYDWAGNETELDAFDVNLSPDPGAQCPSEDGDCHIAAGAPPGGFGRNGVALLLAALGALSVRRRFGLPQL